MRGLGLKGTRIGDRKRKRKAVQAGFILRFLRNNRNGISMQSDCLFHDRSIAVSLGTVRSYCMPMLKPPYQKSRLSPGKRMEGHMM